MDWFYFFIFGETLSVINILIYIIINIYLKIDFFLAMFPPILRYLGMDTFSDMLCT